MRVSLRSLLLAGFLGITALLVAFTALSVRNGLRASLVDAHLAELERSLLLAEMGLHATRLPPASLVFDLANRAGSRVTFVGPDGTVLGDSEVSPTALDQIENHGDRPEVRGALAGEVTFARRRSGTTGLDILYGAMPVEVGGQPMVLRLARSLGSVDTVVAGTWRDIRIIALFTLLLSLLAAHLVSGSITRHLRALAGHAQSLGGGSFSGRIERSSRIREIDALEQTFNRLAEELDERVRELLRDRNEVNAVVESIAEGVVALTDDARILRINRAAMELLDVPRPLPFAPVGTLVRQPELRDFLERSVVRSFDSREIQVGEKTLLVSSRVLEGGAVITLLDVSELRRIERVRRDFVANASHELNTPLTAMRGFAEALLEEDPPEALRRQFLGSIHTNALRLQQLVDDLLDLSRLESGAWKVEREELSLAAVAEEAWSEITDGAREQDIDFEVSGDVVLPADRRALLQIFRNLLENAARYTSPGGRIEVEVGERNGWVSVSVSDNGSGIPSIALPRIFERFYRADPSRARVAGGSGLGLAIVRHLVSTMGGTVHAESELGVGTTIRFEFPSRPPPD